MTRFITDYLVQEHQELSLLLNELQQQLGVLRLARDRRSMAERLSGLQRKIAEALQSHVVEEEQILYPVLQKYVRALTSPLTACGRNTIPESRRRVPFIKALTL
jgi:iron-sulfur cluster repair protein YtfE (RIC family)